MVGTIGVLNVGAGDTKLTFDKNNPAECIRSARIVTDMLRRGYALLVEVERNGEKAYERVRAFDPETCSYIIADFDPITAAAADAAEQPGETISEENQSQDPPTHDPKNADRKGKALGPYRKRGTTAIHASTTTGVAVARSAGG